MRRLALALALSALPGAVVLAQDVAATLADTVRDRGHTCAKVISAAHDEAASRPDEQVWILTCSDARYRVRYPGDTAPQVERLD